MRRLLILFALLARSSATAQDVWIKAPRIDALWAGVDGGLRAQVGLRVFVFDAPNGVPRLAETADLPADAVFFDHLEAACFATSDAFFVRGAESRSAALPSPSWRASVGPPLRAALALGGGRFVLPGRGGVSVMDRSGAVIPLGVAERRRSVGYGLAGVAEEETALPYVFAPRGFGPGALAYGRSDRYALRTEHGRTRSIPPADVDEDGGLQGFSIPVPPFWADFDGDGVDEFVRVDAARGVVAITERGRGGEFSTRPIRLGGPCVAAYAADVAGDKRADLVVVKLPPLTTAQQLSVLLEGSVRASVLVYAGAVEWIGASPAWIREESIDVAVTVRDGVREAKLGTLIAPLEGVRMLSANPGRGGRIVASTGDVATELAPTPAGDWLNPLHPVRAFGRVFAVLRSADGDRLAAY